MARTMNPMVGAAMLLLLLGGACSTLREDRKAEAAAVQQTPVVVNLGSGKSIFGRVLTKDGRGIGGARVFAYRFDPVTNQPGYAVPPAQTVSLEDGTFQIDGLDLRYYPVQAIAGGFSPSERDVLPTNATVDFALVPGGELNGTVVDTSTNAGLEGAKVSAYTHVEGDDAYAKIQARSRPPLDTVTTGSGGTFKLETLGTGTYNILVTAERYQEGKFFRIETRAGGTSTRRFELSRGLALVGTVVSPVGEPVAGARVRLTRIGEAGQGAQVFVRFGHGGIETDQRGRFVFHTLSPGEYAIVAWHPAYVTGRRRGIEAGAADLTIVMTVGRAISGLITEAGSGNPVVGARVSVSDVDDIRKEGISDEKGLFHIPGFARKGKLVLNIHAEGYARLKNLPVEMEVGRARESLHYELHRPAVVTGRVVNEAGHGVANQRVRARRTRDRSIAQVQVGSALTDQDGSYRIDDIEAGEATVISIVASNYLEGTSAPFAVRSGEAMRVADVVLQLGGMVKGFVIGPDGNGIPGVQVMPRLEGDTQPKVGMGAVTDDMGGFLLKGLTAGTIDLVAKSQQHLEVVVGGVKVVEANITQDVRIVLKQGSYVRGVVVDSNGKVVARATIKCLHIAAASGLKEFRTESDFDGKFALVNLPGSETVELTVHHRGHGRWTNDRVQVNADVKVVLAR